jgi:hypothetical protein
VSAEPPKYLGVIASRVEYDAVARRIFPELTRCIAPVHGRDGCPFLYRLYASDTPTNQTTRDVNGDPLVIMKTFTSMDSLQRWVDEHDRVARIQHAREVRP